MGRKKTIIMSVLAVVAAIGVFAVTIFSDIEMGKKGYVHHDYDSPVRTALVNARFHLSQSFHSEEEMQKQAQYAHRELDKSLNLLEHSESLDPSIHKEVEALRAQLSSLENNKTAAHMDGESLHREYNQLLDRFKKLIQRY